jgi:hypothetical protein
MARPRLNLTDAERQERRRAQNKKAKSRWLPKNQERQRAWIKAWTDRQLKNPELKALRLSQWRDWYARTQQLPINKIRNAPLRKAARRLAAWDRRILSAQLQGNRHADRMAEHDAWLDSLDHQAEHYAP